MFKAVSLLVKQFARSSGTQPQKGERQQKRFTKKNKAHISKTRGSLEKTSRGRER